MSGERIATLEAQMRNVERDIETIRTKVDAIHEVIVEHRGFRAAMRSIGHAILVTIGGLGGVVLTKLWG